VSADIRGNFTWFRVQVPLGHSISPSVAESGHGESSRGPGLRPRRVLCLLIRLLVVAGAAVVVSGSDRRDGHGVLGVRAEGSRAWVVGKCDAGSPQVIDQFRSLGRCRDLRGAPPWVLAAWSWPASRMASAAGGAGSGPRGCRGSSAAGDRGGWRWCNRAGTGRRGGHWPRRTLAAACRFRRFRRLAALPAGSLLRRSPAPRPSGACSWLPTGL
jgi:hypothetical protein